MTQIFSGSFMQVDATIQWFRNNFFQIDYLIEDITVIDGIEYLPSKLIQSQLTDSTWKLMQSQVTTLILELK